MMARLFYYIYSYTVNENKLKTDKHCWFSSDVTVNRLTLSVNTLAPLASRASCFLKSLQDTHEQAKLSHKLSLKRFNSSITYLSYNSCLQQVHTTDVFASGAEIPSGPNRKLQNVTHDSLIRARVNGIYNNNNIDLNNHLWYKHWC